MKCMPAPPAPQEVRQESTINPSTQLGALRRNISVVEKTVKSRSFKVAPVSLTEGLKNLHPGDIEYSRTNHRCHYRFAAGRILPKPFVAAVFSKAYYTPGVLELVEALVNPAKTKQNCLVWVFPVPPEFEGLKYKELAAHFLSLGTIPLGLLRGSTGPLPYVCSKLPLATTSVELEDALYVLADRDWAERNIGVYFVRACNGGRMPAASVKKAQGQKGHGSMEVDGRLGVDVSDL